MRVESGLARHIREESTQIAIRVSKVDDVRRAIELLDSVLPYIDGLGVRYVKQAFPAPGGAMIWLDGKGVPLDQLLTIPDRIAQAFTDAGFHDAVVGTAKGVEDTDPDYPHELPGCVSMTLLAAKPARGAVDLPEAWIAAGRQWWLEQAHDRQTWVSLVGSVYPVSVEVGDEMLQAIVAARSNGNAVVAGTPSQGAASLTCKFSLSPLVTLKLGGVSESELLAAGRRFVELARVLAEQVVYGVVEFLPTFSPALSEYHPVGPRLEHRGNVMSSGDYRDYVFDAFPFQVLNEGHLEHLPELPNAEPLPSGRVGLQLGELKQWLPRTDTSELQEQGRALLDPCLLQAFTRRRRPRGD